MTAQADPRELPIRVPIITGESLHSWIEALAARYRMAVRELLPALGITAPRIPYGLILGVDTQALRSLEWQAGLPVGRLDDAVLDRFSALDLAGGPGRAPHRDWQTLWAKSSGSRFCPRCLAENGGRWSLAWYLNWTFACMRHNVLMATRCSDCGRRPRSGENRFDHLIDGRLCCHYELGSQPVRRPDRRMPRCGAPLTEQPVQELDFAHPVIACQRWINSVLTETAEVAAAGLLMPPKVALTAVATLMRHSIVASDGLISRHIAAWLRLPPQSSRAVAAVFRRLGHAGHLEEVLASLNALVEELTEHPPPIDYARRRRTFRELKLVTPARLRKACHQAGIVLTERRIRYVTMMLWETLTGGDIRFANNRLCFRDGYDREGYASFRKDHADTLKDYLTVEAERLLLRHRIDEPVTWQPEPEDPARLAWRSPPADLTRRLPGWTSPSRQGTLRRIARDHTPQAPTPL